MKRIVLALLLAFAALHAFSQNEPDLSVRFIRRTPVLNYELYSRNPAVEGWPAAGQPVEWRAHVKNWSPNNYTSVPYAWQKNGTTIKTGVMNFRPNSDETVVLNDTWAFQRDSIIFTIDYNNAINETSELNNSLKIYTNAISANFYVEQSLYDYFHTYQRDLGLGTNSWDDWMQMLQVRRWNTMFQDAIFPEAPNGILDRIRVDSIVIVPDHALPLAGGLPSNNPNYNDLTVDLQWGFPFTTELVNAYSDHQRTHDENPFFYEGTLLHELGHARYLIDLYAFDISQPQVRIKEGNTLIAASPLMPIKAWDVVYYNKWNSLMSGTYNVISRYEVLALNKIAHRRAFCGNYNSPCNIGEFINDLPENNVLKFVDQNNNIIQNACVEVYQAAPGDGWYGKDFDDIADLMFSTNNAGQVNVGRNPFANRTLTSGFGFTNMDAIIRIEKDNKVGYTVLEAADFNIEYWRGNTSNANYTLQVNLLSCADFDGANCVCAAVLPVHLKDFHGIATALSNTLYWESVTEQNFSHFVVEQSGDGINFSTLTTVAGCGPGNKNCRYEYIDKTPRSIGFYRLKQVDQDGKFAYSETIRIVHNFGVKGAVSISPNPVRNVLNIKLSALEKGTVSLSLRNAEGILIVRQTAQAVKGDNTIRIDVSRLARTIYYLTVQSPGINKTLKVVKK